MKRSEALVLLQESVRDDQPARINPLLTRKQAVEIVEKGIIALRPEGDITLPPIFEKRVLQVCNNRIRVKGGE